MCLKNIAMIARGKTLVGVVVPGGQKSLSVNGTMQLAR